MIKKKIIHTNYTVSQQYVLYSTYTDPGVQNGREQMSKLKWRSLTPYVLYDTKWYRLPGSLLVQYGYPVP